MTGTRVSSPAPTARAASCSGYFFAVVATVVLADKLDLFDMDWIYDWWPVPVLALGIYLIYAAVRDRGKEGQQGIGGGEEADEV